MLMCYNWHMRERVGPLNEVTLQFIEPIMLIFNEAPPPPHTSGVGCNDNSSP